MTVAGNFRDAAPAGMQVRGYVLTKAIAQGGEGIVYEAMHAEHGAVLVKEFWPKQIVSRARSAHAQAAQKAWQDDYRRGIERFISLGERLSALPAHPGVMTAIEVFPDHNTAYLAMRKVPGRSLDEALEHGAFTDAAEIERLADKLAAAMAHIHANGLLHRDIAPDNVIITPGHEWEAVLIDFNAAKDIVLRVSRSQDGIVKPGYTPIEQSDPEGLEPVGAWSDVYSASAVLYRCIAGKPPAEAAIRLLRPDQDKPLRQRLAGKLPEGLLAAIDLGLRPRADDRPQSAEEWQRILGGDIPKPKRKKREPGANPVSPPSRVEPSPSDAQPERDAPVNPLHSLFDDDDLPVSPPPRPGPWARHKVPLMLAGAVVLALIVESWPTEEAADYDTVDVATEVAPTENPDLAALRGDATEIKRGLWLKPDGQRGSDPIRSDDMVSVSIKFLDTQGQVINSGWLDQVVVAGQFPYGPEILGKLAYGDSAKVYFDAALLEISDPPLAGELLTRLNLQPNTALQAELSVGRCVAPETAAIAEGTIRVPCLAGIWDVQFNDDYYFYTGTFTVTENDAGSGLLEIGRTDENGTYAGVQLDCTITIKNDVNLKDCGARSIDLAYSGDYPSKFELRVGENGKLIKAPKSTLPLYDVTFTKQN